MDPKEIKEKLLSFVYRYKYVALILVIGLILMTLPSSTEDTLPDKEEQVRQENLEEKLEGILSQIQGVGKVRVLLTPQTGEEVLYQTDEDRSADGSIRMETVILSGADRGQTGLVRTVTPATFLGAIVVCQGAEDASVRLALTQAVSNVTGLGTDRISIVKMK
jgi:stage III sporulation protein AG